jgi:hypothetical protein
MRKFLFLFLLLGIMTVANAQQIDSVVVSQIMQEVIDQTIEPSLEDENLERQENCIYGKKEGMTLSCIAAYWEKKWCGDLDDDGQMDIIIQLVDEGMGGGGNAFSYDFKIITLKPSLQIKKIYSLYGGGKMSYASLSIDQVSNGKIFTTYTQNPYGYGFDKVTYDNADSLGFVFYIEDNKIQEEHYKKCNLCTMNKNIFRNDLTYKVKRNLYLNSSYDEEQEEYLFLSNKDYYHARISGCEGIKLSFSKTSLYNKLLEGNGVQIKNEFIKQIVFLMNNTRYKTVFSSLYAKLDTVPQSV